MMIEKDTIKCEAVFNDERTHRFLWKRVWNKDKPLAAVVMLNPCQADNIITDTTTSLVVNNVARLENFGGVIVVNLYSRLTTKLNFRWNSDEDLNDEENDTYIKKAAEDCSHVILAWGKASDTNKRVYTRAAQVLELLKKYQAKLFCISDGERENLHPLTPALRSEWQLKPFNLEGFKSSHEAKSKPEKAKEEPEKAKEEPKKTEQDQTVDEEE